MTAEAYGGIAREECSWRLGQPVLFDLPYSNKPKCCYVAGCLWTTGSLFHHTEIACQHFSTPVCLLQSTAGSGMLPKHAIKPEQNVAQATVVAA